MLYYAVCEHGYDGGLIVTASHNPKQYNGMKIVRRNALPLGGDGGIEKVRDRALAGEFRTPAAKGKRGRRDVLQGFAERCLAIVDATAIAPLHVVLDGANGMAGTMMAPILDRLPVEAERCHFEPDGTFPHYQPNPLLEENRQFIIGEVKRTGADLGIAWDGDADRCFFIDDTGAFAPGDFITALIAESMLAKHPGATILYDLRASRAVPTRSRAWAARRSRAASATRSSSTACARRTRSSPARCRVITTSAISTAWTRASCPRWCVLELVSRAGVRLSELVAPLHERYHLSGEINSTVADVPLKLQELKERYGPGGEGGRITHLDGVSVEFDDWHFNVRPSEHRAAVAPQPGGIHGRRDGTPPRRGAGADPLVSAGPTTARPPFRFSTRLRVGFDETDAQAVVYYGRYFPYCDRARVEYQRHLGLLHSLPAGLEFVMRRTQCEYDAPARFDDEIEVFIRTAAIGRSSLRQEYAVHQCESGDPLARAEQVMVLIDRSARQPTPVPGEWRDAVEAFEGSL